MNWKRVSEYEPSGLGTSIDDEPLVLLWNPRYGVALGRIMVFADKEVRTFAAGYHGISFEKFSEIDLSGVM